MNDDIVTRLLDIATLRGPMSGNVIPAACLEAANEILALRKEVEELKFKLSEANWIIYG